MKSFEEFVPGHIRALDAYAPGKPVRQAQREGAGGAVIKLASNENPFGPSPLAMQAAKAAAAQANFYPDNDNTELRKRLALKHGVQAEQILVTAGSTQFLDIIAHTLLGEGRNAVTSEGTFIVYPIVVRSAGAELIQVPLRNHRFALPEIARAINAKTRVVFLANPNNPTGTMFTAEETDEFLKKVPEHVLVVLDEAYCDFAESFAHERGIVYSHSLEHVRQGRNLVVLRTFSKSQGLAGMRVGYGMGPEKLIQHFSRVRPAFSVSGVSEAAALASLDDAEHLRKAVESNLLESKWLFHQITQLGFQAVPTNANFIYFDAEEDAAALARRIQAEGVIVRPLNLWGMPHGIRVTVGTPEQNRRFISALKHVTERAAAR